MSGMICGVIVSVKVCPGSAWPRSAAVLAAPFYALARLADLVDGRRRRGLDGWQENLPGVSEINRWKTFVGRTLIMEALRSTG